MNRKIGLTTTVPIEVIYAAGDIPVDLNNLFITAEDPAAIVERAERAGLPANICAWVKGIYAAAVSADDLQTIVAVTQGDCSNTHVLMELLARQGKTVIPFAYPYDRDRQLLQLQIRRFMDTLGVQEPEVMRTRQRLDRIREKLRRLDDMTWRDRRVTSYESHLWLVSASDFNGDPDSFEAQLDDFLTEAAERPVRPPGIRLGYLGVPPIFSDLFDVIESLPANRQTPNAAVVYNEMARQFAMLDAPADLLQQYLDYTYPYDVAGRVREIARQVQRRSLHGVIHYTQTFCFRQMEHAILAEDLPVPVLWLEGDRPGQMDGRTRTRLESFIEMLAEST